MHAGHVNRMLAQQRQGSQTQVSCRCVGRNDDVILWALFLIQPQTPTRDALLVYVCTCDGVAFFAVRSFLVNGGRRRAVSTVLQREGAGAHYTLWKTVLDLSRFMCTSLPHEAAARAFKFPRVRNMSCSPAWHKRGVQATAFKHEA